MTNTNKSFVLMFPLQVPQRFGRKCERDVAGEHPLHEDVKVCSCTTGKVSDTHTHTHTHTRTHAHTNTHTHTHTGCVVSFSEETEVMSSTPRLTFKVMACVYALLFHVKLDEATQRGPL